MILPVFFAITLLAVLWILAPLVLSARRTPLATSKLNDQTEEALRRHQRMIDLEADHELGKIDEAEFNEMREGLIREEQRG